MTQEKMIMIIESKKLFNLIKENKKLNKFIQKRVYKKWLMMINLKIHL